MYCTLSISEVLQQIDIVFDFLSLHFVTIHDNMVCVLLDFSLTVKAAPHECVIRTSQP